MSHELFGSRFYARQPAWHNLGVVFDSDVTATEALTLVGDYTVELQDITTDTGIELPYKAIVRHPTPDSPTYCVFGIVGKNYFLVTPRMAAEVWDATVGQPVETLGVIKEGRTLFITTRLPAFNVKGDAVDNYLLLHSPMQADVSAEVSVTPVRVVCQNTLTAAKGLATETYRIVHDQHAKERLETWLTGVYNRAVERSKVLKEAFDLLASTKYDEAGLTYVLEQAFPNRKPPLGTAPEAEMQRRYDWWMANQKAVRRFREGVRELLEGKGTGLSVPPCVGTYWGVWNAVAEFADYRRGRNSVAASSIFGPRADEKERAFRACLRKCKN